MWWVPGDESSDVRGEVDRLVGHYVDHLREADRQLVWGVGSAPSENGLWFPLLLISAEALYAEGIPVQPRRSTFERFSRAFEGSYITERLRAWDLSFQALVEVTTRPRAAATVQSGDAVEEGLAVAGSGRRARVGLPCVIRKSGKDGFVTAGHLVGGRGASVEAEPSPAVRIRGTVVDWSDPMSSAPQAGYDFAVVEIDESRGDGMAPLLHSGPEAGPIHPYQPMNVQFDHWNRATRYGMVSGALNQLGDSKRQWLDCWLLGPSGLLSQGDSGSVAIGSGPGPYQNKVFGHFVGGSWWPTQGSFVHLYVQDLGSCLNSSSLGRTITI